jgi:hypothetical protein
MIEDAFKIFINPPREAATSARHRPIALGSTQKSMSWSYGELGKIFFCVGANPKRGMSSRFAHLQIVHN